MKGKEVHAPRNSAEENVFAAIAVMASLMMLVASAFLNVKFMTKLAPTPDVAIVYACIGISADLFMATLPFFIVPNIMKFRFVRAGAAALLWVVCTAFSAQSAIGHIAGTRMDLLSGRTASATSYQDVRKDLDRARKDLEWKAKPKESVDNLTAQVKGQEGNILFAQTSQCANQWTPQAKAYCAKLTELRAKLGDAIEYKALEDKVAALTAKSEAAGSNHANVIPEGADPQAAAIGRWFGMDVTSVQGVLSLLAAMMLLMGASLGPYAVLGNSARNREPNKPAEKPIIDAEFTPVPPEPQGLLLTTENGKPIDFQVKQAAQLVAPGKDLTQDAKELLLAIGMPTRPCDVREKDDRSVLAWRFVAWLAAHGHVGDFTADQVDALYDRYTREDCRTPWATRVVKAELQQLKPQCAYTSNPRQDDGSRVTQWTIKPPSVLRLTDILRRKGIANALPPPSPPQAPEPPAEAPEQQPKNVLSFFKKAAG